MDSNSNNAPDLYDYLYRDQNRISSYSAQLLGGVVASLERTSANNSGGSKSTKLGSSSIATALYEESQTQGEAKTQKVTSLSHDVVITDVIATLMDSGRTSEDVVNAPHGSIVLVKGTLVFIDRHISELAIGVYDTLLSAANTNQVAQLDPSGDAVFFLNLVKGFLSSMAFPSAFLLQDDDGNQVVGTLKEAGMEEPISTYYFKHGAAGLSDVYLLGIKEIPNRSVTLPDTQMLGAGQQVSQSLQEMLFPPGGIKVTPIAMFRKL